MTSTEAARGEVTLDSPPPWRATAAAFTAGGGVGPAGPAAAGQRADRERWARLADLAAEDLSLARLGEGHADAVAILAELDGPAPGPGSRWGVWAASPPGPSDRGPQAARRLAARAAPSSTARARASARTRWSPRPRRTASGCSRWPPRPDAGAGQLAGHRDGGQRHPRRRLRRRRRRAGRAARRLHRPARVRARRRRAWRRAGTAGPAAVADTLLAAARRRDVGPHALAHLGAVDIALTSARAALDRAADEIDADPCDLDGTGPGSAPCGSGPRSRRPRPRSWPGSGGRSGPGRWPTTRRTAAGSPT